MATPPPRQKTSAPDKGSFPIDHEGECTALKTAYMICLRKNERHTVECRKESKAYLECRMENQLMDREKWSRLGYSEDE